MSKKPLPFESKLVAEIEDFFAPQGILARQFPAFEYRPEQQAMAKLVAASFSRGELAIVEAGTGVGKSFAYLIPAALWAKASREKIVLSTFTINLQEQLIKKDIPRILAMLGLPLKAVLVKGWRNYPCLRKIKQLQAKEFPFSRRSLLQFNQLLDLIRLREDLSFSELSFKPDPELQEELACEADLCAGKFCPFYQQCYFHKARTRIKEADLLVVNHAVLCSDLSLKREKLAQALLPEYHYLVVDEAHHLEEVAFDYLGVEVGFSDFNRWSKRLFHQGKRGKEEFEFGFLPYFRAEILKANLAGQQKAVVKNSIDRLLFGIASLKDHWQDFFFRLGEFAKKASDQNEPAACQLTESLTRQPGWAKVRLAEEKLENHIDQMLGQFLLLKEQALEFAEAGAVLEPALLLELEAYSKRISQLKERIAFILSILSEEYAYWLEGKEKYARLRAIPYRVSEVLAGQLFSGLKSGVLTSATLAVGGDFTFIKDRLGLEGLAVQEALYPSSFDFKQSALLLIPQNLPLPEEADFFPALKEFLPEILRRSRGRAFLLFTSFTLLKKVGEFLKSEFKNQPFTFLIQGESPRSNLLERFKKEQLAVLLGTDSFWEGVDVPGEALSLVVIARLPFKVPEDPIVKVQVEALKREEKDPFWQLMVPRAALKLKQGFGRLIRSRKDRGIVLLLDKRVLLRNYGKIFLSTLPDCPHFIGKWQKLGEKVSEFFKKENQPG